MLPLPRPTAAIASLRCRPARRLLGGVLLALAPAAALAADAERCGGLLDRRHSLAARAMAEEIRLAGSVRERLCPELNRRADAANANPEAAAGPADGSVDGSSPQQPPFDYGAFLECRHQAEAELARTHRVLHRNRLGFPFYTEAGAAWARASDQLLEERARLGCPGAL
ncbi:MAG: hypothetical protein VKJ66_00050 [Synechococcus sp.]|nr:hypothetical protein [Synechococcus sp.]